MPRRSKTKSTTIVVRPIERGTRHATKAVLGTLTQLNRQRPLHMLDPVDWALAGPPKPWKQPKSLPASCKPQPPRRNPGRDDGETWVSANYVCGRAIGPDWEGDDGDDAWKMDVEREWARDLGSSGDEDAWGHDRAERRREVQIMDIAKPMKPRGISREFEVVDTVRRVIALEEDQTIEWTERIGAALALDEWEILEETDDQQAIESYAELVQLRTD
ncbi:hypothetical protein C2E23DRAFT_869501 [Lenzites betulinus]|nr:hypothetical protein C2E23DRAFT_869501 [Lenzites betulinus]